MAEGRARDDVKEKQDRVDLYEVAVMLADGCPLKAREIYNTTRVADAVICSRYLFKQKKEEEYYRQRLYAVIIKCCGGSFEPDAKLLSDEGFQKTSKKSIKANWKKLANKFGVQLSADVSKKLNGE